MEKIKLSNDKYTDIHAAISRYLVDKNPADEKFIYEKILEFTKFQISNINRININDRDDLRQIILMELFRNLHMFDETKGNFLFWCQLRTRGYLGNLIRASKSNVRKINSTAKSHTEINNEIVPIDPPDPTDREKLYDDTDEIIYLRTKLPKIIEANFTGLEEQLLKYKFGEKKYTYEQMAMRLDLCENNFTYNTFDRIGIKIRRGLINEPVKRKKSKSLKDNPKQVWEAIKALERLQRLPVLSRAQRKRLHGLKSVMRRFEKNHPEKLTPAAKQRWNKIKSNRWCHRTHVPQGIVRKIRELKDSGLTARQIAEIVGLSPDNTKRIWLRYSRYLPPTETPPNAPQSTAVKKMSDNTPEESDGLNGLKTD